jgi:hypothetical protein
MSAPKAVALVRVVLERWWAVSGDRLIGFVRSQYAHERETRNYFSHRSDKPAYRDI